MKIIIEILGAVTVISIIATICIGAGYLAGKDDYQEEVEQRALELDKKDCYSWQDIEVIIFKEIQE